MEKHSTFSMLRLALPFVLGAVLFLRPPDDTLRAQTVKGGEINVTGKITSGGDNNPIAGASILVKGTNTGTNADADGNYSIAVPNAYDTLVISAVGFIKKELAVGNQTRLNVELEPDEQSLSEVVVIGYGSQKKRDLTGAVAQISARRLENENPNSVQDILRGNAAGVNVGASTSAKGGGGLRVRGRNTLNAGSSPLIVLDGAIYYGGMEDINPNDIETVDVLKDASAAAVFGAKAASGVIIVTTKRGKDGKPQVNINTNVGFSDVAKNQPVYSPEGFINWREDVMKNINLDSEPYRFSNPETLPSDIPLQEWMDYDGSAGDPTTVWLQRLGMQPIEIENYKNGRSVNWYNKVFQVGLRQDHTVSLSGKSKDVTYYMSFGYLENNGIIVGDRFSTIRARINLEGKVNKYLSVGANVQFADRDESQVPVDWDLAKTISPWGSEYDSTGNYIWRPNGELSGGTHPYYDRSFIDRRRKFTTLNPTLFARLDLPFGFTFTTNYTPRFEFQERYQHRSAKNEAWAPFGGDASRRQNKSFYWQIDNILKWNKTFANIHQFEVTLLANAEKFQNWSNGMTNEQFNPTDLLGYHNIGAGIQPVITSDDQYSTGDALMARIFYSLRDRYQLTLTGRRDGYSAFGQQNPRALFGSMAVGWVFSDEKFFNSNWLNYGKLRASWGTNGNRDIGRYVALSNLSTGKYLYVSPSGQVNQVNQLYVDRMQNPGLKWERTLAYNLGLDFSLLNNRIDGSFEAYSGRTKDLLVERSLPDILGFSSIISNLGQVNNWGLELTLNSTNIDQDNLTWRSTFNFQMNRNKIVHLYGDLVNVVDSSGNVLGQKEPDDIGNGWFIGRSIDAIWNYQIAGIWQTDEAEQAAEYGVAPGDFKVVDRNNDGKFTNDDKVFQGFSEPRARLTVRNEFKFWKSFDISFMLYSYLGHQGSFNQAKNRDGFLDRTSSFIFPYWTPENPINDWARLYSSEGSSTGFNVYRSKSFIRFENISLAYTFPQKWMSKIAVTNLKIYANVRNLTYWAPEWDFWDPENSIQADEQDDANPSSRPGPTPRIFTIGLDITL